MTHLKVGYAYISIFLPPAYSESTYTHRTTGVKELLMLMPAHHPELV